VTAYADVASGTLARVSMVVAICMANGTTVRWGVQRVAECTRRVGQIHRFRGAATYHRVHAECRDHYKAQHDRQETELRRFPVSSHLSS
jgi:hypothetical protein